MELDFSRRSISPQFMRGDICSVSLETKPEESNDDEATYIKGDRPCIVMNIIGSYALILPLTRSDKHNYSGFSFILSNNRIPSYPRFDMINTVPCNQLYDRKFNIIVEFGQGAFDSIIDFHINVVRGNIDLYEMMKNHKYGNNQDLNVKSPLEENIVLLTKENEIDPEGPYQSILNYDLQLAKANKTLSPTIKQLEDRYGRDYLYKDLSGMTALEFKNLYDISNNLTAELRVRYGIGKRHGPIKKSKPAVVTPLDKIDFTKIPNNPRIISFIADETEQREGISILTNTLYRKYKEYSKSKRVLACSKREFDSYLPLLGFPITTNGSGYPIFKGIQLKDEE